MFKNNLQNELGQIRADERLLAATRRKIASSKPNHAASGRRNRRLLLAASLLCSVIVLSGVAIFFSHNNNSEYHSNIWTLFSRESKIESETDPSDISEAAFEDSDITTYSDYASIKLALAKATQNGSDYYSGDYSTNGNTSVDADSEETTDSGLPSSTAYSETNTQVAGVDEADIIKNDGAYVYYVSCGYLFVIDVRDPENIKIVTKLTESGLDLDASYSGISDIFYDSDSKTLSLIYCSYMYYLEDDYIAVPEDASASVQNNKANMSEEYAPDDGYTLLCVYDVSDPASPRLTRSFAQEGNYLSSRRIDSTIYLVSSSYTWYDLSLSGEDLVPAVSSDGSAWAPVAAESIHFVDDAYATSYTVVSAIDTTDMLEDTKTEVVAGSGNVVYCSSDTLYVTTTVWNAVLYSEIEIYGDTSSEDSAMSSDTQASDSYYQTKILSFDITNGNLSAKAAGSVDGMIINQYALDAYDGFLRIATTTGDFSGNSENNVFVLDTALDLISSLTGLAPGESIYSVRFYGDTIYMVTFVQVDPLFVIDASDPYNLSVLGELKISGYSNYMQLIGDDLLLAIGQETYSEGEIVTTAGLKIAVFDVSDPENPVLISSLVYGDSYGSSTVSYNPKCLLIDMDRGLIGLPVSFDKNSGDYGYEYEEGFLLLRIDASGNLTHEYLFNELDDGYSQCRGIYIGDTLFVLSNSEIASFSLTDYSKLDSEILA